jgi:hypothetical protein
MRKEHTFMQVWNCSAGKSLSPDSGAVLTHVNVVMPCFRRRIFSPCVSSMMYFLLQTAGIPTRVSKQSHLRGMRCGHMATHALNASARRT